MIRWDASEVTDLLTTEAPDGMIELWQALPPGTTTTASALASARRSAQIAITQGISLVEQKVVAATGLSVGFRPEIFDRLADVPGFDTLSKTAELAITGNLDIGDLAPAARDLMIEIIGDVAELAGLNNAFAGYAEGLGAVVAVVWQTVTVIVQAEKEWAAYQKALADASLECVTPAYSAQIDKAQVDSALALMSSNTDWRALFLPEGRPFDPDYDASGWGPESGFAHLADDPIAKLGIFGFTCCPTAGGNRVITPVGVGIGNRVQSSFPRIGYPHAPGGGYGLLPMCPQLPIHRAIIAEAGTGRFYDPAKNLPQLAGLGQQAWRVLWGRGPSAFAVDGRAISSAWSEYLGILRNYIGNNVEGIGGNPLYGNRVCDDWGKDGRTRALKWMFSRIGADGAEDTDGIYSWSNSLPIKAWDAFTEYQESMLERLAIFYVDARSCAPEWREAVTDAQREALDHPTAVCDLDDWQSIPDPELRSLVDSRRKSKGAQCFAVAGKAISSAVSATEGPSLAPLGESSPEIPTIPALPRPARGTLGSATPSGGAGLGLGLGLGAAALVALLLSRR